MFKYILTLCLIGIPWCGQGAPAGTSVQEITGNPARRVATVSNIVARHKIPPTTIKDARFLKESIRTGTEAPSATRSYCVIELAPQDVAKWSALLTPLPKTPQYAAPARPPAWWVSRDTFSSLQFYKPDTFTGKTNGWTGVSAKTGQIYFFTSAP